MPALVDDVEVEHHLDVAVALQFGSGFPDRHVFADREDVGVHDAAGGPLVVLEQVLDDARFLGAHHSRTSADSSSGQVVDQGRIEYRGACILLEQGKHITRWCWWRCRMWNRPLVAYTKENKLHEALVQAVAANRKAVDLATKLYQQGQTDFLNVVSGGSGHCW